MMPMAVASPQKETQSTVKHLKQYNYEAKIYELDEQEQHDVLGHRW